MENAPGFLSFLNPFDFIFEVVFDQRTGQVDYNDNSITENTRVSSLGAYLRHLK